MIWWAVQFQLEIRLLKTIRWVESDYNSWQMHLTFLPEAFLVLKVHFGSVIMAIQIIFRQASYRIQCIEIQWVKMGSKRDKNKAQDCLRITFIPIRIYLSISDSFTVFYRLTNFIVSLCILHQIKKRKRVRLPPPDLFLVLPSPLHTGAHMCAHTEDCESIPTLLHLIWHALWHMVRLHCSEQPSVW